MHETITSDLYSSCNQPRDHNSIEIKGYKLDEGQKKVMRGKRSFLQKHFKSCKVYSKGHTHWLNHGKAFMWRERVDAYLKMLGITDCTPYELAIVTLLIYPAFGPSSGPEPIKKGVDKTTWVYKLLKDEGMQVYKLSITKNNNQALRDKFFNTDIIQRLWNKLMPLMKLEDFFTKAEGNPERNNPTYMMINKVMNERYGLTMCKEWV